MPRETFLNLKEDKRERIIAAALREISTQGYDKASVTRIVNDAGIATGSFYQYFEDMDDLFVYIGQEGARLKAAYMQQALEEVREHDMESFVRALYQGGLRFGLEHQEYFQIVESFLQIKGTPLYQRMFENVEQSEIFGWLYQFITKAIQNGELPSGITPELFFRLVAAVNTTIIESLIAQKPNGAMTMGDLETVCDLGLHVLLYGLTKETK